MSFPVKCSKRACLQGFSVRQLGHSVGVIAWAAGLYEGEGTATRCAGRLRLSVRMTNEETVRRFGAAMRCGTVYGPYTNGPARRLVWMWVAKREDALRAADLLRPWLSKERCAQLERVFRAEV